MNTHKYVLYTTSLANTFDEIKITRGYLISFIDGAIERLPYPIGG